MDTLLIAIIAVILVGGFIISNLLAQISILENETRSVVDVENHAIQVYETLLSIYTTALNELIRIDKNGAFSSDDEVGFAFRTIMETIEHVKHQMLEIRGGMDTDAGNDNGETSGTVVSLFDLSKSVLTEFGDLSPDEVSRIKTFINRLDEKPNLEQPQKLIIIKEQIGRIISERTLMEDLTP